MLFSLDVRRARKGDCLLLHFGDPEDPGLILIDGGPASVYQPELKPRLQEIRQKRSNLLEDGAPLPVDVLMVSHTDDDHIKGILEFTDELVNARRAGGSGAVVVGDLWHNTIDEVLAASSEEMVKGVTAAFGPAALAGEVETDGFDPHTAKVFASIPQGAHLRDNARALNIPVNHFFGDGVIKANGPQSQTMRDVLKLTVVGPLEPEVEALRKDYAKYVNAHPEVARISASFTDKSVANLSSLVYLVEVDGQRMLLTGDARGDKILKGLEQAGLLAPGGTMKVDLFKVPHHGSDRDLETIVFERIVARHYVFSGNGEHGNPERETFEMLRKGRGQNPEEFEIHLTYSLPEIDAARKKEWEKDSDRPAWNEAEQGLIAFFEEHPELKARLRFVEKSKPHVVDLLDPLGF